MPQDGQTADPASSSHTNSSSHSPHLSGLMGPMSNSRTLLNQTFLASKMKNFKKGSRAVYACSQRRAPKVHRVRASCPIGTCNAILVVSISLLTSNFYINYHSIPIMISSCLALSSQTPAGVPSITFAPAIGSCPRTRLTLSPSLQIHSGGGCQMLPRNVQMSLASLA